MLSQDELLALMNDTSFCQEKGFTPENIPAMLLPDTYDVYWNISAESLLDRMEQELGTPATVVATGGISKFVVPLCRRKLLYDRTLMLKGLNLLYQRNVRA